MQLVDLPPAPIQPWVECPLGCGDYWCEYHDDHVADCPCPAVDVWAAVGRTPYKEGEAW